MRGCVGWGGVRWGWVVGGSGHVGRRGALAAVRRAMWRSHRRRRGRRQVGRREGGLVLEELLGQAQRVRRVGGAPGQRRRGEGRVLLLMGCGSGWGRGKGWGLGVGFGLLAHQSKRQASNASAEACNGEHSASPRAYCASPSAVSLTPQICAVARARPRVRCHPRGRSAWAGVGAAGGSLASGERPLRLRAPVRRRGGVAARLRGGRRVGAVVAVVAELERDEPGVDLGAAHGVELQQVGGGDLDLRLRHRRARLDVATGALRVALARDVLRRAARLQRLPRPVS